VNDPLTWRLYLPLQHNQTLHVAKSKAIMTTLNISMVVLLKLSTKDNQLFLELQTENCLIVHSDSPNSYCQLVHVVLPGVRHGLPQFRFFLFEVLGIELRALNLVGKFSAT
jgi:hypothetical protein